MKAALIALALVSATAHAEDLNFATLDDGTSVTALTTGAEHGLVVGAGYGYVASVAEHPLVLTAELTVDAADARNLALRSGALAPLAGRGRYKLIGGAAAVVRSASNDVARMIDVGADVTVLAGRYSPRWFVAAELGLDSALATHLDHTAQYRMQVYADARDGWYHTTGALLRTGAQLGTSVGKTDIALRLGILRNLAGDPPTLPFYATLSVDRRW